MKIAVGSTNPVKIAAVSTIVLQIWPEATVIGVAAPSGVSDMPLNEAEIITGATNRALAAREQLAADFGIGLEGGVHQEAVGWMLQGWVAAVARNGRISLGGSIRMPLPEQVLSRILAGAELGPVIDELLGEENIKQKGGAVATFTAGLINRQETFAHSVACALAPFITPHLYQQV